MRKEPTQIYMDYRAMRQKADYLEELANELRLIVQNEVANNISNKSFWKGDSGDACRQKLTKLEKNLNKRVQELQRTANAIRTAADRQYKLEMALVSLVSR